MDKQIQRRSAQPNATLIFSDEEKKTIIDTVAKGLSQPQVAVFFYTCQALGLNPLLNEIAAVSYKTKEGDSKLSIQVMRDGFLSIAHRSGKFAGLESGVNTDEKGQLIGWAKVYHKDFTVPVYQEADFSEYDNSFKNPIWKTKPKTMIKKVAESMALRKAFNVNGVYAPEEMEKEITVSTPQTTISALPDGDQPADENQIATIVKMGGAASDGMTKQEAAQMIKDLAMKGANHGAN